MIGSMGLRAALVGAVLATSAAAYAEDTVIVALSRGGVAWDFSVVGFGKKKGFFAEQGINVEIASTENTNAGIQAVIGGSADIANAGVTQFIAATTGGAPLAMISSSFVGTADWLWYARTDSPLQSFDDVTDDTKIAITSLGSSNYIILTALIEQYGVNPEIIPVGSSAAVMTQVMTGQADVGVDGNGLLGVPQYDNGEVRPIALGRDIELMRNVSVRGLIVNKDELAARRDTYIRFVQAYQKTIDWMYEDPLAVEWFAERTGSSLAEAERVKTDHYPAGAMNIGDVTGLDVSISQGLEFKRIERAPTEEELAEMFDILWKPETM